LSTVRVVGDFDFFLLDAGFSPKPCSSERGVRRTYNGMNTPLPEALNFHAISAIVCRTCRAQSLSSAYSRFPHWLLYRSFHPPPLVGLRSRQPSPVQGGCRWKHLSECYLWSFKLRNCRDLSFQLYCERQVISTRTGISFLTGIVNSDGGSILKSVNVAGMVPVM
jgi:hypothetical protein